MCAKWLPFLPAYIVDLVIKDTDVEDDDDKDDDRYISEKMSIVDEMIRITRRN